jgi:hypothetical protein
MRQFIIGAALLALAAPAFAQQPAGAPASDTLKAVTTKGIILSVAGMDIDVKYTPDGKFTAMDGRSPASGGLTARSSAPNRTWRLTKSAPCIRRARSRAIHST